MEFQNQDQKLAALEAILFLHGEPLQYKKISKMLEIEVGEVEKLASLFKEELTRESRGITLIVDEEKIQLATKPSLGTLLESFVKEEFTEELTPASLETLSIIAYLGPISRSRIDYLRGVNSLFILRSLRLRGLIERVPDPAQSSSYLYKPSMELIRHLGFAKIQDLPEYEKFNSILSHFQIPKNSGEGENIQSQQNSNV
jgi:segregation and condensation protein B